MSDTEAPLFVVPRFGKRHTLSEQALKDQDLTADRMRQNAAVLGPVCSRLEYLCGPSPQKKDLLVVARELSVPCHVSLDRLAKRSRDCLLCWFCEHWQAIEPSFSALCSRQPRAYDSRNSCVSTKVSEDEDPVAPVEQLNDFDFNPFFPTSVTGSSLFEFDESGFSF
jgi:hypothetical protein